MSILTDTMVKPYRPGVEARRAILATIREVSESGERVTVRELSARIGLARSTVGQHVATLRDAGLIDVRAGRSGGISLTESGRIATD